MATLRYHCLSDPGKTHDANEDRWFIDADGGLFVVADGMANETAPELVVQQLPGMLHDCLASKQDLQDSTLHAEIQSILVELSGDVRAAMHSEGEIGLGTTLVTVCIREGRALVVHVGDSRAYLFRDDRLEPVTEDHSLVQELLRNGIISEEQARESRRNGGPTRFLGMGREFEADFRAIELCAKDQLLLCTDGLTEMLSDERIKEMMHGKNEPEAVCQALVDAANEAGGLDNITAMSIIVDG